MFRLFWFGNGQKNMGCRDGGVEAESSKAHDPWTLTLIMYYNRL